MNGDGIKDLVLGDRDGFVYLYTRNDNGDLRFEKKLQSNGKDIQVQNNSSPDVADWNNDGLLDLIVGCEGVVPIGYVYVYLNIGTKTDPKFGAQTMLMDATNNWMYHFRAMPAVYDINRDGKLDLVVGDASAKFTYYENTGSKEKPALTKRGFLQMNGQDLKFEIDSRLTFTDWDENGVYDIVIGDHSKNVFLVMSDGPTKVIPQSKELFLPGIIQYKNELRLSSLVGSSLQEVRITSLQGKTIISKRFSYKKRYSLQLSGLTTGIYLLTVNDGNKSFTRRLTVKL